MALAGILTYQVLANITNFTRGMRQVKQAMNDASQSLAAQQVSFSRMLGGNQQANAFVAQIKSMSSKSPFKFDDLRQNTQQLMNAGIQAKGALSVMRTLGDASAGLGVGQRGLNSMVDLFAKWGRNVKVTTGDIDTLETHGVRAWQELSRAMQIPVSDVRLQARAGNLTSGQTSGIVLRGMQRDFGGSMASQQVANQRATGGSFMSRMGRNLTSDAVLGFSRSVLLASTVGVGAVAKLGVESVKAGAQFETQRVAFTRMLGSAQKANDFLAQLGDFARKTPFQVVDLEEQSKRVMAWGFSAQQVLPLLRDLGDAASGLGIGSEGLDRMVHAFGQMNTRGKVAAMEMNQLTKAGVNAWKYLAEAAGTSQQKVRDAVKGGMISSAQAIPTILAGLRHDFGGMMDEQSKTLAGMWSNVVDSGTMAMRSLGQGIADALPLKQWIQGLSDSLFQLSLDIKTMGIADALDRMIPDRLEFAIYAVSGAIGAAMIPAVIKLSIALVEFLGLSWPIIAAGLAMGISAYIAAKNWEQSAATFQAVGQVFSLSFKQIGLSFYTTGEVLRFGLSSILYVVIIYASKIAIAMGHLVDSLFGWIPGVHEAVQRDIAATQDTLNGWMTTAAVDLKYLTTASQDLITNSGNLVDAWGRLSEAGKGLGAGAFDTMKNLLTGKENKTFADTMDLSKKAADDASKVFKDMGLNFDAAKKKGQGVQVAISDFGLRAAYAAFEGARSIGNIPGVQTSLGIINTAQQLYREQGIDRASTSQQSPKGTGANANPLNLADAMTKGMGTLLDSTIPPLSGSITGLGTSIDGLAMTIGEWRRREGISNPDTLVGMDGDIPIYQTPLGGKYQLLPNGKKDFITPNIVQSGGPGSFLPIPGFGSFSPLPGIVPSGAPGVSYPGTDSFPPGFGFEPPPLPPADPSGRIRNGRDPFVPPPDQIMPTGPGRRMLIPALADGGTAVRSGLALVGEAGPELLSLPRGASVVPLPTGGAGGWADTVEHSGTITVRGVNSRDELVGVTKLLARELLVDQDRYGMVRSARRIFK